MYSINIVKITIMNPLIIGSIVASLVVIILVILALVALSKSNTTSTDETGTSPDAPKTPSDFPPTNPTRIPSDLPPDVFPIVPPVVQYEFQRHPDFNTVWGASEDPGTKFYGEFDNVEQCNAACAADSEWCAAWAYHPPGMFGDWQKKCYGRWKNAPRIYVPQPGMISGIRTIKGTSSA